MSQQKRVMSPFSDRREATLTSRFRFSNPALLFPRARLGAAHLDLLGWRLRGRYRRRILLDQILHVDVIGNEGLLLWLVNGETVRLHIERARRWREAIEARRARLEHRKHHPASAQG